MNLESCETILRTRNCTNVKGVSDLEQGSITFTPQLGVSYQVVVDAGFWSDDDGSVNSDLTFSLELAIPEATNLLAPEQTLHQQIVGYNSYDCYSVNVDQYYRANGWTWLTALAEVTVNVANGQASVLLSA